MNSKPKVIMLLDNHYGPDYRVEKEALRLLTLGWEVDIHAVQSPSFPKEESKDGYTVFRDISLAINHPFSKAYRDFKKHIVSKISTDSFDVIHCHDFKMFLLGAAIKKAVQNQGRNVKMIYDSHEFLSGYPLYQSIDRKLDRLKGKLVWNWFVLQERKNIGKADYVISVSQSICDELERKFSLANPSVLLRNIPKIQGIEKSGKKYFHEKYGLSPEDKVIIHTGNAFFSLDRLALLVRLVREHSEAYIVFLGSRKSIDRFKPYVKKMQVENKIFFHSKVAKDEVTRYCSMADIGLVFVWKPQWISYWFSFPNKLFDVSLAGLPSLATAQPEFERFNREHGHMVTFDGNSYEALNKAYNHLLNTYEELKKNALKIRDSISWEYEAKKLDVIYQSILHDKQDHS